MAMTAEQFGWVVLLQNGLVDVQKSYYGGYEDIGNDKGATYFSDCEVLQARKKKMFEEIKASGIDWDLTEEPFEDSASVFEGTFADSGTRRFLAGRLYLKDGRSYYVMDDEYRPASAFDAMANIHKYQEFFDTHMCK